MKTLFQSLIALLCATALAQEGNVIPFQGQLASQAGEPLTPTTPVTIVFRLYQTPIGGTAIWEEAQPNISVNAGRFSVLLGSRTLLPAPTYFNGTLFLGLTVDDGDLATTDVEMRPRQALVPVISASYARHAQNADKLNGFDWSELFGVNTPSGSVLPEKISDGSLPATKLVPDSITSVQISSSTISSDKLALKSITAEQIAQKSLTIELLAQEVLDQLVPPGTIVAFGGHHENTPAGWLLCDGTEYDSSLYPRLHGTIAHYWGGKAGFTFRVPDLRGMFLRGLSRNTGRDPDMDSRVKIWDGEDGNFGGNVGSYQADQFASHRHWIKQTQGNTDTPASGGRGFATWNNGLRPGDNEYVDQTIDPAPYIKNEGGAETRPKNVYVNYIIKY